MSATRALLISLGVLALGLVAANLALGRHATRHFVPAQRMQQAVAQGRGCVVVAGDSRMAAGVDDAVLANELRRRNVSPCVANISIGALQLPGIAVAIREYLHRGGAPRAVVLGISLERLLPAGAPVDASAFIGNEAISLGWSESGDVDLLFADGWLASPAAFDRRFRFATARRTALGSYLSLGWQKVQAAQDVVTGARAQPRNQFGALGEMSAYGARMEEDARARLARALSRPEAQRLDPWFGALEDELAARHVPLLFVEVPMPASFRRAVTSTDQARLFREWLVARLGARGESAIDLSSPDWLGDEYFPDHLHLSPRGAALFSTALGEQVAGKLTAPRR